MRQERGHGHSEYLDRKGAGVITVRATETVKSAADRMRARSIAALVVTAVTQSPVSYRNATSSHAVSAMARERLPWKCGT